MTVGPSAYWYVTRASGAVALILLTLSLIVGVAAIGRVKTDRWPRFAIDGIHRTGSLLALAFLIVHIATAVLDSFAPIRLVDAVIPFAGSYRPLWLGLGAVGFDLLLAVIITSLVRARLGYRSWRAVHWLAYLAWPVALVHGLGTGSDVRLGWMLAVNVLCTAIVLIAVVARDADRMARSTAPAAGRARRRRHIRARAAGLGSRRPARAPLGSSRRDTTRAAGATSRKPGGFGMTPPRLLLGVNGAPVPYGLHTRLHGQLPRPANDGSLIGELARAALRGRGGAEFPLARKLDAVRRAPGLPVVVINACEGEPMSVKDRVLIGSAPHLVLDGALCCARAVGATELVIALDALSVAAGEAVEDALAERPDLAERSDQPSSRCHPAT